MSHVADSSRVRRGETRSSAEAALPPPNSAGEDFSLRALELWLADAVERRSEAITSGSTRPDWTNGNVSDLTSGEHPPEHVDLFRSVLRSLSNGNPQAIPPDRAGLGSTIVVRDPESGERFTYEIVPFDLIDGSLRRVTVASPVGQVLLGARPGDVVEVETPLSRRTLEIEDLQTLWDLLDVSRR